MSVLFFRKFRKKKYTNCVRTYFSCFTKVFNIQNTQSSKTILVNCWFFCTPQRAGSVFVSWHLSFSLFVLLIVNLNCWLASRQNIVNWIAEGINYLKNHPDVIKNSFRVCGITMNNPDKVRNDEFLKKIMNSVKDKLADEEEELLEDEDPFSCVK